MSNAVAVGKKLGVQPTLARRVAAAGRNGKRLVTGDPENANRVIGKAAPGTNGLGMLVPAMRGQARNALVPQSSATATGQQKGSKLAAFGGTKPATAGMSGATATPTASAGASSSGAAAGGIGKAFSLSGVGEGVSALRSATGRKAFKAGLSSVGSTTRLASPVDRTARVGMRMGEQAIQAPVQGLARAAGAASDHPVAAGLTLGGGAYLAGRSKVDKRRYDPEDERRHRQGALAASGMLGGGALTVSGGREVVRDTKGVRRARADLDPGPPPMARSGEWRSNGRLRKPTPQESLGELMAHDKDMKLHGARLDAYRKLRNPKGAVVSGRAAGKVGAGLALLGAGAQLHRQRREPRFD